jgi:hypothetical protein
MSAVQAEARNAVPLRDDELVQAFEDRTLDPSAFTHRRHLQVAWFYLRRHGFAAGSAEFCKQLKKYVTRVGAAAKYHETITWAYLVLLNEEMELRAPVGESFDAMIARRPDLLDHRNGALSRRYRAADLENPDARRVFVLPMRAE